MKKIMKSVLAIAGILALASCSSAEDLFTENLGDNNKSVKMTFTASQENGSATRTAIGKDGENTKIWWSEYDKITVTNGTTSNDFTLTAGQGTTKATFEGNMPVSEDYYAIYPNQSDVTFSDNKFSGIVLNAVQEAVEGSFDPEAAIMVAKSNGTNFQFKNVVAYFKVTPTFDCSEIVVTAHKSTDALAGTFEVNIDSYGIPSISNITNKSREVKLTSTTGTIEKNKDYYILLLPGTFEYGFSVTLKPTADTSKKYFKQRNTSYTLNRNDLCDLGKMENAIEVSESKIPYITFKADAEQKFSYYNYSNQANDGDNQYLQYSVDGSDWDLFGHEESVTFGGGKGDLRLRAKEGNGNFSPVRVTDMSDIFSPKLYTIMFKFGSPAVSVECEGDIRTLIDYENYYCANTSEAKFEAFFRDMTNLTSAPDLPNMELANKCYQQMFYGCTGLTTAPALPATTLADNCYYQMFQGCSNLSNVTMLATNYSASNCLTNWLTNAGTSAGSRKLTLASEDVYNGIISNLPTQWQKGYGETTVSW